MFVIIPVPYEATTCFGKGTKNGPAAILSALPQVEEFDIETQRNFPLSAIKILPALPVKHSQVLPVEKIEAVVHRVLQKKNFPIVLGGEHSISAPVVRAAREFFSDLSVLYFDAHADLRDQYQGRPDSHACAARRLLEICPNVVQVGIRSLSEEEYVFARSTGQINKMFFAKQQSLCPAGKYRAANTLTSRANVIEQILSRLSKNVYISFDVDVLDPSEMPACGTPEPDGLRYHQVVEIIRAVVRHKNVIGMDLVELAPVKGLQAPNYLVARLLLSVLSGISFFLFPTPPPRHKSPAIRRGR